MPLALEDRVQRLWQLLTAPEVKEAMRERCEEQGHDYENCCSVTFRVYQRCKWCGEER
jgi:hypothetical protein